MPIVDKQLIILLTVLPTLLCSSLYYLITFYIYFSVILKYYYKNAVHIKSTNIILIFRYLSILTSLKKNTISAPQLSKKIQIRRHSRKTKSKSISPTCRTIYNYNKSMQPSIHFIFRLCMI